MLNEFQFEKIDKSLDWKGIFDQLDSNFSKVAEYLATLGNRVMIETFTAKYNQSEFTLSGEYNAKHNCLAVYKNGVRQWLGESFTETSTSSFTMSVPCNEGDKIVAVYNKYYVISDTAPLDCILLQSPDKSVFKITVNNDGSLKSTKVENQ